MFTDMVGYTALMQENEALALSRRSRHREVLEASHANFNGKIVQYFGDGTLSVFDSAVDAVRCGIEIQLSLLEEPKVPLRIGIHTGDIVYSQEDIIGDGVNIASRLESFAIPGAILVSDRVVDDLHNHLDVQTQSVGVFELKNVSKPMEIFAISNSGLVVPRAEEISGKGQLIQSQEQKLPVRLTSFIGREVEVAEIKSLLLNNRLVTLTGPGGTGKTSLSIRVAEDMLPYFKDGVFFVPLAPINDPGLLASAIAKVLEVPEIANQPVLAAVKSKLREKECLLILDNFEQIVEAASKVLALLEHCPKLKIMVSSRIILRINGEQEYPVQPLILPDITRLINLDLLGQFPSVRLFVERAKTVKPNYELDHENAFEIAEICNRLDGLPLAIELAAARMRLFSSKTLLEKLTKSLDVLKSKDKGRPARHQTLRQTISWSYDLLSPDEQLLFQRLSVFTGTFILEAAEEICEMEDLPDTDIYEGIEALLEKSLIRQVENENRDSCFLLLETIKEFAWNNLLQSGKATELKERHAHYYLDFVEEAAPELTGANQADWMNKIEARYDNIRAAILWTIETKTTEIALRFGIGMWRFWLVRNQVEGWDRLKQILGLPKKEHLAGLRATTLSAMGASLNSSNNPRGGRELLEESVAILREIDAQADLAISLNHLGHSAYLLSDHDVSIELTNEALALGQALGLDRVVSTSYNNLGFNAAFQSKLELAHLNFSKSLEMRKALGDKRGYAYLLVNLAWTEIKMGEYEKADVKLQESLRIVEENDAGAHMLNWVWIVMVDNLIAQGKWADARVMIRKTEKVLDDDVYVTLMTMALIFRAEIMIEAGEFSSLDEVVERAEAKITAFGHHYFGSYLLVTKLRAAVYQKQREKCERIIGVATKKQLEIRNYLGIVEILELIAQFRLDTEAYEQAAHALITAKALREERNLFLPLRFINQIEKLEFEIKARVGVSRFGVIEEELKGDLEKGLAQYQ